MSSVGVYEHLLNWELDSSVDFFDFGFSAFIEHVEKQGSPYAGSESAVGGSMPKIISHEQSVKSGFM